MRREPKLASLAMLAFGLLAVGLIATTTQWRRADANAHVAQTNAHIASERLWDSRDQAITRHMESAEGWRAALLLLDNIAEMEAQGQRSLVERERKRLGIIENANPKLIDVLPVPPYTSVLAFSPDARQLAASPPDELDLRLFDLASGKQLWRRDNNGNPYGVAYENPTHMEFDTSGQSLLVSHTTTAFVPFPLGIFMYRVDARSGRWLPLPQIADSTPRLRLGYSPDGGHAVTFQSANRVQFWRADPWRVIASGPKFPGIEYACAVLFAPDMRSFACRGPEAEKTWLVSTATLRPLWEIDPEDFGNQQAWAFSPDSRWLALGDGHGAVIVANAATREIRRLSPRPRTEVHELAFSEDGAWLAAATGKGGIHLWKWPEGRLLAWPFGADMEPERVRLDRAHLRVLASGTHGAAGIWQIPETEFEMDRGDAVPVGDRIATPFTAAPDESGGGDAIAWRPGNDVLANVAAQRVLVQRLPPAVLKRAHAAPIKPSVLRFDGRRLVSVAGRRVRLIEAGSEKPLGPALEFPQPPGFAELTGDGKTLVVTVGRSLHAYDVANGKLRFAPVALTNSPQHVALNPDGASVVTTWLDHDVRGRAEVAEAWDLRSGRRIAGPIRFPGAQNDPLFNVDGTRLLVWNFAHASLRDGHTLAEIPGPLADLWIAPNEKLDKGLACAAAFDPDGTLWLSLMRGERDPELRHYGNGTLRTIPTERCLDRILPISRGALAAVPKDSGAMIFRSDGATQALPDPQPDTLRAELAASADGRWLARARRNGVVLFDARTQTRIAVLYAALPAPDIIWQLAFSPDGNRLLARSMRNRLMVWNLQPDTRQVHEIARELALRDVTPGIGGGRMRAEPTDAERAALRANDPGAQPAVPVVEPSLAVRMLPGGAIPPRDARAPPELLDLTAHYNFGFGEVSYAGLLAAGDYAWIPAGIQRYLGVDYDLRGGIQMQAEAGHSDSPRGEKPRFFTVAAPRPDIAAVDTLLLANPAQILGMRDVLEVTLHYADGGKASQRTERFDSLQISGVPGTLAMAAFGYDARAYPVRRRAEHIYAVRFPNPELGRAVRSITFSAGANSGVSAVVLAATVEPLAAIVASD
jgi:WD40 repeat protein